MFLQVTVLWEVAACSGSYFCECGWGEAIRFFLNDSKKKNSVVEVLIHEILQLSNEMGQC